MTHTPRTVLPANVTVGTPHTEYLKDTYETEWTEYPLTLETRGHSYPIGTLVEYPAGHAMLLQSASIRTSSAYSVWSACIRAIRCEQEIGQVMYVSPNAPRH